MAKSMDSTLTGCVRPACLLTLQHALLTHTDMNRQQLFSNERVVSLSEMIFAIVANHYKWDYACIYKHIAMLGLLLNQYYPVGRYAQIFNALFRKAICMNCHASFDLICTSKIECLFPELYCNMRLKARPCYMELVCKVEGTINLIMDAIFCDKLDPFGGLFMISEEMVCKWEGYTYSVRNDGSSGKVIFNVDDEEAWEIDTFELADHIARNYDHPTNPLTGHVMKACDRDALIDILGIEIDMCSYSLCMYELPTHGYGIGSRVASLWKRWFGMKEY